MKRLHSFTMVETLAVIGIIAVLAAMFMPAAFSAKTRANIQHSLSNLRQFHLAVKLYQSDHDGEGKYGDLPEMGLPPAGYVVFNRFGTPLEMWKSPCGLNPQWSSSPVVIHYVYRPGRGGQEFEAYAKHYEENLLLFFDLNCASHTEPLYAKRIRHRGLGVLLSGQLINHFRPGNVASDDWWSKPTQSQ